MNIAVVYWSGTGNTEQMAQKVALGARQAGATVDIFTAADFSATQVASYDGLAFGCPAMGAEVLEEEEFAPMFDGCLPKLAGKPIVLFGSYGWGDGEWMRNWEAKCREDGANLVQDGVICNEEPDDEAKEACQELGRALAQ